MEKKFIINIQGKDFVLFEGLLSEFHSNGGKEIHTEELPTSTVEEPKFRAKVIGEKGTFTGHGDANNLNTSNLISKHKYRMAETRAIARALRWYNNIGMCSADELGGDDKAFSKKTSQGAISSEKKANEKCTACGVLVHPTVANFSKSKMGKVLCRDCQKTNTKENIEENIENIINNKKDLF